VTSSVEFFLVEKRAQAIVLQRSSHVASSDDGRLAVAYIEFSGVAVDERLDDCEQLIDNIAQGVMGQYSYLQVGKTVAFFHHLSLV